MKDIIKKFIKGFQEIMDNSDKAFPKRFDDNVQANKLRFNLGKYISNFVNNNVERGTIEEFIKEASIELTNIYKDTGVNRTNLQHIRKFYKKYRNQPNILDIALKLDWSHNIELLNNKLNDDERIYYLTKAVSENWSLNKLKQQIKNESYDSFLNVIEKNNYRYNIDGLIIKNYKSLVNINIANLPKFMVFAGANASGKSNIFEAIEFLMHSAMTNGDMVFDIFGGKEQIINYNAQKSKKGDFEISLKISLEESNETISFGLKYIQQEDKLIKNITNITELDNNIQNSFSRIFIDNTKRAENKLKVYNKLWLDTSNLSKILAPILDDKIKKEEIIDWVRVLIPEIESIVVDKDISGKSELKIIEKSYPKNPFVGNLISEGTYNIIALLTLFYQSNKPQFVCIEEPEIGLNPAILSELVPFFREMTEKYNHHIWITTHSTSLVSELIEKELFIVNKKNGETNINVCKEGDFEEMKPDEAWLSNMLKGGGLPW